MVADCYYLARLTLRVTAVRKVTAAAAPSAPNASRLGTSCTRDW